MAHRATQRLRPWLSLRQFSVRHRISITRRINYLALNSGLLPKFKFEGLSDRPHTRTRDTFLNFGRTVVLLHVRYG